MFIVSSQSEKPARGSSCGPRWSSVNWIARSMCAQTVSSGPSAYADGLVQVREVAGLTEVGADGEYEPEVVVAEPLRPVGELGGKSARALAGERVELVPGVSVEKLEAPKPGQRLAGARRSGVHGAERVLRRVACAHPAADTRLVGGDEARPVEGRPALDLVPEVDHRVQLRVGRLDRERGEVGVPVVAECPERPLDVPAVAKRRADALELGVVSDGAEHEDDLALLAGRQLELVTEDADAVPARRADVRRLAVLDHDRIRQVAIATDERLAIRVESQRIDIGREEAPVRSKHGAGDDHAVLEGAPDDVLRPVEVLLVDDRVGKAELHVAEAAQTAQAVTRVADPQSPELARPARPVPGRGNEVQDLGCDSGAFGGDARVAGAVSALVPLERPLHGLPRRAPVLARVLVA